MGWRDETTPAERALIEAAFEARTRARCTYSGFAVGAALRTTEGSTVTGANVENASYTLGLCAERVGIFHALTHGATGFTHIAVATDTPRPTTPCGACRQILWEFAREAELLLAGRDALLRVSVRELCPHAFDESALE